MLVVLLSSITHISGFIRVRLYCSLCKIAKDLFDVGNDDGDDEVGDGDGDKKYKADEQELDESVAAPHIPHRVEGEVVVKVVLPSHHVDHLEKGGERVVEDMMLPHGQVEREGKGQQDRREH
jgi:hypothetical protein